MGYPVDRSEAYLIEGFGTMQSFRKWPHSGDDWTMYVKGKTVYTKAVYSGVIRHVGSDPQGAGNWLVLEAADGGFWVYGHHAKVIVPNGARVEEGAILGIMGATGFVTGPHLHIMRYTTLANAMKRYVAPWRGGSVDAWAAASGLTRPSQHYTSKDTSPTTPTNPTPPKDDFLMALSDADQQILLEAAKHINRLLPLMRDDQTFDNGRQSRAATTQRAVDAANVNIGKIWDSVSKQQGWELMEGGWTYNLYMTQLLQKIAAAPAGTTVDVAALAQELSKQNIQVQAVIPDEVLAQVVSAAREGGEEAVKNLEFVTVVK